VEALGPLGDLMAGLVERICERLVRRGLSADRFDWACRLADRTVHEGSSTPAVPVNEAAAVVALVRSSLESRPPRGAVEAITLRAHPARVAPAQASLTDLARPSPRLLTTVLTRLAALVGARALGVPVLMDSHRSDAVSLVPPSALSPQGKGQGEGVQGDRPLALRRFRPPLSARVTLTAGRPAHLQSERLTARIVASAGPWRSSGEWWSEHLWRCDEWDAELPDGTLCRLTHDGTAWWLDGIYD
jgi:protein ImuB